MLLSRGVNVIRTVSRFNKAKDIINLKSVRHSHEDNWCYRTVPVPRKAEVVVSEIIGGIAWWWILWNVWHGREHLVGEYEYPDASKWTDEELGIPPE